MPVLDRVLALHAAIIVPGHGEVQRNDNYVRRVRDLLSAVLAQVAASRGPNLEAVRRDVHVDEFRRTFAGDDPALQAIFDDSVVRALVERAFLSVRGGV